jgi:glycosyltransferase involved in cell wall biosynthesis
MKRRLVILTEIISPYRIPLFNALAQEPAIDPHLIFLSETDPGLRQWRVYKEEIKFSYEVLPSWRRRIGKYNALLNRGVGRALRRASPDVIVCGGYSYVASWQALRWARARKVPFLLWSESALQDGRGGYTLVEFLKQKFLEKCDAFVVPGISAREYLRAHAIENAAIFDVPNAVDNDFFSDSTAAARQRSSQHHSEVGLPARYFLFAGRLVPEKGVFDLLAAYAKLDAETRSKVGLIFAGEGVGRQQLEQQAAAISPGTVRFLGFAQREQLAILYGLADALILPSHSEAWGLVVNEAMACGLPVLVSKAAGCTADLVRDGWNGRVVVPGNLDSLCSAMQLIADDPGLVITMGDRSREHIRKYSPESWSQGLARAIEVVGSPNV